MNDRVKVAIFGLGRIGTIHAENLLRNHRAHITLVGEANLTVAQKLIEKWHLTGVTIIDANNDSDVDLALASVPIDAVLVCTPSLTHPKLIQKALLAGKKVFCEKPLAVSFQEIDDCYKLAAQKGLPLLCGFNRRFDSALCDIKRRIAAGEIGEIQMIKITARDEAATYYNEYLNACGGIFQDMAIHDFDQICWFMGEFPISISVTGHAFSKQIAQLNQMDAVAIVAKFPSGAIAILDLARSSRYGYDSRCEVFGDHGQIICGDDQPLPVTVYGTSGIANCARVPKTWADRYRQSYVNEMEHFLDVASGRSQPEVTREETLAVNKIAAVCDEAAVSGKVTLNWNEILNIKGA